MRSPNTCCSKKILLLLVWQALFTFSWCILNYNYTSNKIVFYTSNLLSCFCAPLIGWLADVRFGRYEVIKFGSFSSFLASILCYFALFTEGDDSTLSTVLSSVATIIISLGFTCYAAAMVPFISDQIIGATSDELSAVVRWYVWAQNLSFGLSAIIADKETDVIYYYYVSSSALIFAVPLAVIIISDCLCQQWLDRTHKVTNPIKLIIQVLNYTRKHSYPERRSAFTYIDEEQPTRMDYGKEKFGGPFTEEEVEDVKTILRLLPLVICLSLNVSALEYYTSTVDLFYDVESVLVLNAAIGTWFFPVLLIPLYQLLLYRCFRSCSLSMLRCIGASLLVCTLGFLLLSASEVWGVVRSHHIQQFLSCTELGFNGSSDINPGNYLKWYWKLGPFILYGVGGTATSVLLLEVIIAQSPDKMKGLTFGLMITFRRIVSQLNVSQFIVTFCYDLVAALIVVVLFVVFLVLSKCYTLRERNREINIQAIVEEHYERYLNQEEEYMRQPHF